MNELSIDNFILEALNEDIGMGDVTTDLTVTEDSVIKGRYIAKEDGIICGLDVAARVFAVIDKSIEFTANCRDGDSVSAGDIIAEITGNARNILKAERVSLNLLQHLSGIATRTNQAVREVAGTKTKICDTRKTTPLMRGLEKYAVKTGGGYNHRFNLADGILIKDNHIVAAGGITKAVGTVRENAPHTLRIEVECETFEQINEALAVKADIIMLDNMTVEDMTKAVTIIDGRAITEASGNMGDKNLREIAAAGVDYISIGALTHSIRNFDISLKFIL